MHRGVRELVRWVREHDGSTAVRARPPASTRAVSELEQRLGTPLPADLRLVLGVFDGAALPNGALLSVSSESDDIRGALDGLAGGPLLLPFHRTDMGSLLAFDRSAAPVSDTWPIVDFDPSSGERRLIHRTFDGWCRLCVREWTSSDHGSEFTVDQYLAQGLRHAEIEPDVSTAHVTVAHALRRAGEPRRALESYLRAGRCVPAVPWCDWEALKLAVLLRDGQAALEAGGRLGRRAPKEMWFRRETTPSRVAYALATLAPRNAAAQGPWLRVLDQLVPQALDAADDVAARAIRRAVVQGEAPESPSPPQTATIAIDRDPKAAFAAVCAAYYSGEVRDDDLVLDTRFAALWRRFDPETVLRIRRDF
jgi:hypothetical protein